MTDIEGMTCEWNLFATSHGKDASDGVSEVVKRAMNQENPNRKRTTELGRPRSENTFVYLTEVCYIY